MTPRPRTLSVSHITQAAHRFEPLCRLSHVPLREALASVPFGSPQISGERQATGDFEALSMNAPRLKRWSPLAQDVKLSFESRLGRRSFAAVFASFLA